MKVEIISKTADALETICTFGKNCYSDEGIIALKDKYICSDDLYSQADITAEDYENYKINKEIAMINFVKGLIKSEHYTPIESVQINFAITGVSRALMAQLTRHRIATFCIKSQRYVKESGVEYVTPQSIKNLENNSGRPYQYHNMMEDIQKYYNYLIDNGVPAEDARYVLPNSCETSIGVSFNLRSLMHFMELRLCSHAQWEIRELATLMRAEVIKRYPWMAEFLQPKCIIHKRCTEKKPCNMYKNGELN